MAGDLLPTGTQRCSRIRKPNSRGALPRGRLEGGGYRSPDDEIPGIQHEMIETMIGPEAALRPYLNALQ